MSRGKTTMVKKRVMGGITKVVPGAEVKGRKIIECPKNKILVWASRDYEYEDETRRWYGFFKEEFKDIKEPKKTVMLFTTGNTKEFLMIPFKAFEEEIMPYLRTVVDGYFFLFSDDGKKCFVPLSYIPKKLRKEVGEGGIPLDKYVNNLSFVGGSYKEYKKLFESAVAEPTAEAVDVTLMIKAITEKDPSFFAKSIEEKLITLRYNLLKI